jgi:uncharacterized protein (UPF0305 family)
LRLKRRKKTEEIHIEKAPIKEDLEAILDRISEMAELMYNNANMLQNLPDTERLTSQQVQYVLTDLTFAVYNLYLGYIKVINTVNEHICDMREKNKRSEEYFT